MASCRSCGAEIRWAKTQNGRSIPLDEAEGFGGNICLREDGVAVVLTGEDLAAAKHDRERLWRAHFASCPFAGRHRKTK